ncbi:hypothetical protein V5799_009567 [Amblyomma americanum]|uniref:Secreted protein n=1 Tax=Amblyomma americanum TaxID=6943 RepID=A0AAQ4F9Y5_AMBAM
MNCLVSLAVLAAFVSLLLAPDTSQAGPDSTCDLDDCAASCSELGAMRWSCEEEGCLCTFLVDDAKSLELGEEIEGEGQDGRGKGRPKIKYRPGKKKKGSGKDRDSAATDKDSSGKEEGGPGKETGTGNSTNAPDQGLPSGSGSGEKDQGQKDQTSGGQSDKDKGTAGGSPHTSKKPDKKESSENGAGQKDMGTLSLLSRQALEPDSGSGGKKKSNFRGRAGTERSNMHMPFLVRSLERPLSQEQVMNQLKKQKGDIPMKKIEEFIMKG